jgi:hypothetical protein
MQIAVHPHRRTSQGVQVAAVIREASQPLTISRSSFRPFLVHTRRERPRRGFNTVARAAYTRIGFTQLGSLATVLF